MAVVWALVVFISTAVVAPAAATSRNNSKYVPRQGRGAQRRIGALPAAISSGRLLEHHPNCPLDMPHPRREIVDAYSHDRTAPYPKHSALTTTHFIRRMVRSVGISGAALKTDDTDTVWRAGSGRVTFDSTRASIMRIDDGSGGGYTGPSSTWVGGETHARRLFSVKLWPHHGAPSSTSVSDGGWVLDTHASALSSGSFVFTHVTAGLNATLSANETTESLLLTLDKDPDVLLLRPAHNLRDALDVLTAVLAGLWFQ
eukprot:COSAG01_NODE_18187_length_1094_cov_9.446231_1_plen_256_part_01